MVAKTIGTDTKKDKKQVMSRELLEQAKWIAKQNLDPMGATGEINFQVGCDLFIKRVDVYLAKPIQKPLSDDEINDVYKSIVWGESTLEDIVRATERAHGII